MNDVALLTDRHRHCNSTSTSTRDADDAEHPPWRAGLDLAYSAASGITVPTRRRHHGPLRILKGHRQEGGDGWEQIIVHPPGGIAARDQLQIDVHASEQARVLFTSPGAAKWYRCAQPTGQAATQRTHLIADSGAIIEWLPQENILFAGCDAQLQMQVDLDPTAALLGAELICLGRPAGGQAFTHGRLRLQTRVSRSGTPLFIERIDLQAGDRAMAAPAGLAGRVCFGTLLAVPAHHADLTGRLTRLVTRVRESLAQAMPPALGEVAVTALSQLIVLRWRGDHAEDGWQVLRAAWQLMRAEIVGRAALAPRIWSC